MPPPTVEGPLYKGATLRCNAPAVEAVATITWQRDGLTVYAWDWAGNVTARDAWLRR